ncbi:MAG: nuclear transport factor 2 family protein [Asgard group archaeon]|nr:nuclear transport factor 2 family protein [Asgard group archaeon]
MNDSEIKNIQKSLDIFLEGLRTLDYDKISEIFFEKAISSGVRGKEISFVYRDHWKEMREKRLAEGKDVVSEKMNYSMRTLNIVGNAASVIIDLTFGTKETITEKYVDFYHMLKVKDKWLIVNKIFPTNIK